MPKTYIVVIGLESLQLFWHQNVPFPNPSHFAFWFDHYVQVLRIRQRSSAISWEEIFKGGPNCIVVQTWWCCVRDCVSWTGVSLRADIELPKLNCSTARKTFFFTCGGASLVYATVSVEARFHWKLIPNFLYPPISNKELKRLSAMWEGFTVQMINIHICPKMNTVAICLGK